MYTAAFLLCSLIGAPVLALPSAYHSLRHATHHTSRANDPVAAFPEMGALFEGNKAFREQISKSDNPKLLATLTEDGQHPEYMFLGCSDSRVSEGTIFSAKPGTLFTQRNIANQYRSTDPNSASVLSYAVAELGVGHVIIMGHYGCGGVGASIASAPPGHMDVASGAIQSWISPIRSLYESSTRAEVVALREANANKTEIEGPKPADPGFRALVEENVKHNVEMITRDPAMKNHWSAYIEQKNGGGKPAEGAPHRRAAEEGAKLKPVFVHGFVYDIENGQIADLGVSRGPPGIELKSPPAEEVKRHAARSTDHGHSH